MTRVVPPAVSPRPRGWRPVALLALVVAVGTALLAWWIVPLVAAVHGWRTGKRAWRGAALAVPAGWAGWLVVRSFVEPVAMVAGIASSVTGLPLVLFLFLVLAFGSAMGAGAAWIAGTFREVWTRRQGGHPVT